MQIVMYLVTYVVDHLLDTIILLYANINESMPHPCMGELSMDKRCLFISFFKDDIL